MRFCLSTSQYPRRSGVARCPSAKQPPAIVSGRLHRPSPPVVDNTAQYVNTMVIERLEGEKRFSKVKSLKRGAFGRVVLAQDAMADDKPVAVKYIPRENVTKYVETELINHRQLIHPHIIGFQEVFYTDTHLGIALDFADGGDMFEYVLKKRRLGEDEARWFFQQLIIALDYCHRKGVVNRDIKLENTLISWNAKGRAMLRLCDFGYAKDEKVQSACGSRVGTPQYLAPEVITCRQGEKYDGKAADIWSCGVMMYVMLVGAYPFEKAEDKMKKPAQQFNTMLERIVRCDYSLPDDVKLSSSGKNLLKHILVADPLERYRISDVMNHAWFRERLPPAALTMNEKYLKMRPSSEKQSEDEIRRIIEEARNCGTGPKGSWLQSLAERAGEQQRQ